MGLNSINAQYHFPRIILRHLPLAQKRQQRKVWQTKLPREAMRQVMSPVTGQRKRIVSIFLSLSPLRRISNWQTFIPRHGDEKSPERLRKTEPKKLNHIQTGPEAWKKNPDQICRP